MALITVLIPDGDGSKELTFDASRWEQIPGPRRDPSAPVLGPLATDAGRLDLYAGKTRVASFMLGTWMAVWFTSRKEGGRDRRF